MLIFLSALIFLSSCSTGLVDSKNAVNYREVSSISQTCSDIILSFFNKNPVGSRISSGADIATYPKFKEFLKIKNVSSRKLTLDDIDMFINSRGPKFLTELNLNEQLKPELMAMIGRPISTIDFDKIFSQIFIKKVADLKDVMSLQDFAKTLLKFEFEESVVEKSLMNSFLVNEKILPSLNFKDAINLNVFLKNYFIKQANQVSNQQALVNLVVLMKAGQFDSKEIQDILKLSPFYKNLTEKSPSFEKSMKAAFKQSYYMDNEYILDNMVIAIKIITSSEDNLSHVLEYTNTSYNFFKSLERLSKISTGRSLSYKIERLADSPFCRRMKISRDEIETNLKRIQSSEKEFYEEMLEIYPVYNGKKSFFTLDQYDKELEIVEVKDQCGWGSCWLNSSIEKVEMDIAYETGERLPLSVDYSYMKYILNAYKVSLITNEKISEGRTLVNFNSYAKEWGIIPSSVWQPKVPFYHHENSARYKRELSILKDQFQSFWLTNKSKKEQSKKLEEILKQMDELTEFYFGKFPESFEYKGQTYTPQEFLTNFYPKIFNKREAVAEQRILLRRKVDIIKDGRLIKGDEEDESARIDNLGTIEKTIINSLDKNRAVTMSMAMPTDLSYNKNGIFKKYINNITGELSSDASPKIEKNSLSAHAVLIVGYELDKEGNLASFKILNSWGEKSGDKGFYHMDLNYFKNFIRYIMVDESDGLGFLLSSPASHAEQV